MRDIAVIILNWNGAALLRRYLPVVVANSPTADVIVADNGSTDESLAVLANEFPLVRVIAFDMNYGFAEGYNRALRAVEHRYVVLLNSDVAPAENWLQPLRLLMEGDARIAACAPKILDDKRRTHFEYAGAAGGYVDGLCYPYCRGRVFDKIEEDCGQYDDDADVDWVSGAALMVRRSVYNEIGGLDATYFAHMEEIDFCLRLRNRGHRVVACGGSAVYHLGGATLDASNPRKTFLNFRNSLTTLVKNYRNWGLILVPRLVLDGAAGVQFLLKGKPRHCWAIVRGHLAFYGRLAQTIAFRRSEKQYIKKRARHEPFSIAVKHYLRLR